MSSKCCTKCKIEKEYQQFHSNKSSSDSLQSWCKDCINNQYQPKSYQRSKDKHRNWQYKRKYKITLEQYNEIFNKQNGKCAGCLIHQSKLTNKLCVDHCHTTGKVRGLLCFNCNTSLGKLKDSVFVLQNLINYLKGAT